MIMIIIRIHWRNSVVRAETNISPLSVHILREYKIAEGHLKPGDTIHCRVYTPLRGRRYFVYSRQHIARLTDHFGEFLCSQSPTMISPRCECVLSLPRSHKPFEQCTVLCTPNSCTDRNLSSNYHAVEQDPHLFTDNSSSRAALGELDKWAGLILLND